MRINKDTVNTLIDRYGYYSYIVKLNKSLICECVNASTKEPNPYCKRCLGTGYHIRIIRVFGASREGREFDVRADEFPISRQRLVKRFVVRMVYN